MKTISWIYWVYFGCIYRLTIASANGQTTTDNLSAAYSFGRWPQADSAQGQNPAVLSFKDIYIQQLGLQASRSYSDSFGPQNSLTWVRDYGSGGYTLFRSINDAGKGIFRNAFRNSFREALVESFDPIDNLNNWTRNLIVGTIGDTAEEKVSTTSTATSDSEESWWNQMRQEGSITYGVRPLDSNPYFYTSTVWKNKAGDPIMLTYLRCHYDLLDPRVAMEGTAVFPLSDASDIILGVSCRHNLRLFDSHEPSDSMESSLRWNYFFGENMQSNLFLGCEVSNASGPGVQVGFSWKL